MCNHSIVRVHSVTAANGSPARGCVWRSAAGPVLALTLAVCAAACASEQTSALGPGGPENGFWEGDGVKFTVVQGAIEDLWLAPTTCAADSCKADLGGDVSGRHALAGIIGINTGNTKLEGTFETPYLASGSFTLIASDGCCQTVGAWSAEWVKGLPVASSGGAASSGASSGGAASSGASSGGATGSPDWGGASTGDIHPGPSRSAPAHKDDSAYSAAQNQSLEQLNALRGKVGAGPISLLPSLTSAAQLHADFYVQHHAKYQQKGLSPHSQDKSFGAGFTGVSLVDRTKAAGYNGKSGPEIMAFTGSVGGAIQGWLATVYHRLPLIDPRADVYGFGMASSGNARTEVMDFGYGGSNGDAIIVYPWPGQTGVPKSWSGNEGPQPPKPKTGYPSGPVVTARFAGAFDVKEHRLLNSDGAEIEHVWLTASNDPNLKMFDTKTVVLYANDPLASGTYEVELKVVVAGETKTLRWSFDTKS